MSAPEVPPLLERILRVLPAVLYLTFTWFASATTADALPSLAVWDKLLHFGEYALLALLLLLAGTAFDPHRTSGKALLLAGALSIAWGALDEYHQSFVATRDASALDLAADAAGSASALALAWILAARDRRRR